jgi:hypothetical protein
LLMDELEAFTEKSGCMHHQMPVRSSR